MTTSSSATPTPWCSPRGSSTRPPSKHSRPATSSVATFRLRSTGALCTTRYWRLDNAGVPQAAYIDRWSLPSGRPLVTVRAGSGPLLGARLVDRGTRLLVVSADTVSRFDARSMRLLRSVRMDPAPRSPSAASVSPDGRSVVIGSADGAVSFADVSTGGLRRAVVEHGGPVGGAIYADDPRRAVTFSDDGSVIVWNTTVAAPASVLPGPAGNVAAGALSSDGRGFTRPRRRAEQCSPGILSATGDLAGAYAWQPRFAAAARCHRRVPRWRCPPMVRALPPGSRRPGWPCSRQDRCDS